MFIFKAYELMLATGNKDSVRTCYPYIKATADRLVQQSGEAGKSIPESSESTYDEPGKKTPEYACGIALAAYLAVVEMAKFIGEDADATKFRTQYEKGRKEYRTDYFKSSFGTNKDIAEGDVAGYSWARYLCLEAIMDSDFVATGVDRCYKYYSGMSNVRSRLGRWHFYGYDHFGGAAMSIGNADMGMEVHKWDYDYYYTGNPGYIFWQTLQSSNSEYASYMTAPCVWRSYFQMTGYLLDNANNRLWIRPSIPSAMNKKITNALLLNPKGMGTLNYDENSDPASPKRKQKITVAFDADVTVKEIVLKNNTGSEDAIYIKLTNNGTPVAGAVAAAEGTGFEKNIRVTLASATSVKNGLEIEVYRDTTVSIVPAGNSPVTATALPAQTLSTGKPIRFSVYNRRMVSLEVYNLNGSKIGTLFQGEMSGGERSFVWNGKTIDGLRVGSRAVILRLTTPDGSITKQAPVLP